MTNWWWVRHGPTHEKAFVGWRDVPADLSDTAAVTRLNAHLPDDALLVSSDLIRTIATADAIAGNRVRLPHERAIRELNSGDWDGMEFSEVAARDPDLSRSFWENPGDVIAPNGESWNMLAGRISLFVNEINARHPDRDIVAVAHIGVILTQIQLAGNLSAYQAIGHSVDNLSVTRMGWDGAAWKLGVINHKP